MTLSFLTSALEGSECPASRPNRFTPEKRAPFTDWIGGLVGSRAGLNDVQQRQLSSLCRESNTGRAARSPSLYELSNPGNYCFS
jgi:hypothetical protein